MPEHRKHALLYIRESDISLATDSTTFESALKALVDHAKRKGYIVNPEHIFKEAISGYHVYYFDRPELMKALKVSERHEVDVFLVTEIRALSRRGAGEVLVFYNILQKANVSLETLNEEITDDPMGEVLLSFHATWARVEREQSFLRMQRGKKDRMEIGQAVSNGKAAYGYILVDTEKEVKGQYQFNETIIHTDPTGKEWSEIEVRRFILECLKKRQTLRSIVVQLHELGIPPPRESKNRPPCWFESTIKRIAEQPINIGEVWANRWKKVYTGKTNSQGRPSYNMVKRPKEERIRLPDIQALIDRETYKEIMRNFALNQADAIRNKHYPEELGLLRGGYIICGVCEKSLTVRYGGSKGKDRGDKPPYYRCWHKNGHEHVIFNHSTVIAVKQLDEEVKQTVREALLDADKVRCTVAEIRSKNKPVASREEVEETIAGINMTIRNLVKLAEKVTDEETFNYYRERVEMYEKQKREANAMLYVLEDNAEECAKLEAELQRFEKWAASVQALTLEELTVHLLVLYLIEKAKKMQSSMNSDLKLV